MSAVPSDAPRYIPEIDGLRACAVIAVLLFHFFPAVAPGGFIGVDIFFVISGFVISRSFLFPLVEGKRTLTAFYIRRVRRLAPAYFLVIVATTVGAALVLEPRLLKNFSQSLAAQPVYLQNFIFWMQGEYFDNAVTKPLLHTWSLAVEEQFYLLFGLLVLMVRKVRALLVPMLLIASVLSVALGIWLLSKSPKTSFYFIPTRIWEFGLGFAAFFLSRTFLIRIRRPLSDVLLIVSLGALLLTVAAFGEDDPFPGIQAYSACLVTALLLWVFSGEKPLGGNLLTVAPMRYFGKLSYSLYLWHWPLIALVSIELGRRPTAIEAVWLMALSVLLSDLTYRYIEDPVRKSRKLPGDKRLVNQYIGVSAAVFLAAAALIASKGWVYRYSEPIRQLHLTSMEKTRYRCSRWFRIRYPSSEICARNAVDDRGGILVLGDSHADQLDDSLAALGERYNRAVYLTVRSCDINQYGSDEYCSDEILDRIVAQALERKISLVIATSFWKEKTLVFDDFSRNASKFVNAGLQMAFSEVIPHGDFFDPRQRAALISNGGFQAGATFPVQDYRSVVGVQRTIFGSLHRQFGPAVEILKPAKFLCDDAACDFSTDGLPNYVDTNHLSKVGIGRILPMYEALFKRSK